MKKSDKYINRILIIAIIVTVNVFSLYVFKRFDLTKTQAFTLSRATRNVIDDLDEPITIRLFFSRNLPAHLNNVRNYVRDLLQEYQTYSRGRVRFEFINPDSEERFRMEAERANIPPIPIEIIERDRIELREVFLGASVIYRRENTLIPLINATEGLEFLLTNTIKALSVPRQRHIAYFQPLTEQERAMQWELPIPHNVAILDRLISSVAILDRTDLFSPLPASTDMLIINAVRDSLHVRQLYEIDQFIMRGKPVLIFQDRYVADLNMSNAHLFDNNFLGMMRAYGIHVKPSLVLDANCFQITTQRMQGGSVVPVNFPYPFFPMIQSFSDTLAIHTGLRWVQVFYTSGISYAGRDAMRNTPILFTSPQATEIAGFQVNTDHRSYANLDFATLFRHGPVSIANLFRGTVTSFFADRETMPPGFVAQTENAVIFVAGTTSLLNNDLLANSMGNASFILNLIDYLTGYEDFIFMRSRDIAHSSLVNLSSDERRFFRNINLVLPFVIIVLSAVVFRAMFNRHKKRIKRLAS